MKIIGTIVCCVSLSVLLAGCGEESALAKLTKHNVFGDNAKPGYQYYCSSGVALLSEGKNSYSAKEEAKRECAKNGTKSGIRACRRAIVCREMPISR